VKRSKAILERSFDVLNAGGVAVVVKEIEVMQKAKEEKKAMVESFGYAVIDQSERYNILLAELVRTLLKASPKHKKEMMSLWAVTIDEAMALVALLVPHEATMHVEINAMRKIVEQLKLAKLACKNAMRQGKNVLRCMIGENPHPTRHETESQFPDAEALQSALGKKAVAKKKIRKNDPSLGERALLNAVKKVSKKNTEAPGTVCTFGNFQDDCSGLPLTMLECYILTLLCTNGVPIVRASNAKLSELTSPLSWNDVAKALELMARQQLQNAMSFVKDCEDAVTKAKDQGHKPETITALETKVVMAQNEKAARAYAASTAADAISDPLGILGKKR
jgi:hypothetical protein